MGTVILVGAGPGDPGLLTLKGRQALEHADVVVYDRLVSQQILSLIPASAQRIDVGKQAGNHPVPQEEINRILLEQAQAGKNVVRLKGGDPFLFGRGGEELELLVQENIPFQVIPGITSALAAPAYGGIPVTHRDFCSSVHIITGHAKAGAPLNIPFDALCRTGGTLVFLMGVSALPRICAGLLDAGMDPNTPSAMVERGTQPGQRKVCSTLDRLPEAAAQARIQSPAVIIVGQVCQLSEKFDWFSALPLKGVPVIVTRPADRSSRLCQELTQLGADVYSYPCIRTQPRIPCPELETAIQNLSAYRWLVFTSPAGPACFFRQLNAQGLDARALAHMQLAAIGPKTAAELERFGLRADLVPTVYDSQHLAQAMEQVTGPVLICRASQASPALPQMLTQRGIPFKDIACYDTLYESPDATQVLPLLKQPVLVTFTSASTVRGFVQSLPPETDFSQVLGCCIGAQTAQEAQRYGIAVKIAKQATIASLIESIKECMISWN